MSADLTFLAGGGEMGERIRAFDWPRTPLGAPEQWPQSLRTIVSTCLNSRFPILVWWGRDLVKLYNDAYIPILGSKHPAALGRPGREVWAEIWHIIGPMLEGVMERGDATWSADQMLPLRRRGYTEECYFTFTYSPIRAETGNVGGVFCAVMETTRRVIGQRRLAALRELSEQAISERRSVEGAIEAAAAVLTRDPADIPFALLYLLDESGRDARLVSAAGTAAPDLERLRAAFDNEEHLCLGAMESQGALVRLPGDVCVEAPGPWPDPPTHALVLPISRSAQDRQPEGFVVAGLSPRLELDEDYRGFLQLVAGHIAMAVGNARAHEEEKRRAEALADIDRAKTAFFTNISHEFRTPLTLLLGPLEDLTASRWGALPHDAGDAVRVAHRNGMRLLKLVNALLDFSRIEAGRIQARYEPVDLAAFTAELASVFRSAIERAGMQLQVHCPPLPEAVFVDRDMWEKIVLNLLSNAFKYTLDGEIEVRQEAVDGFVCLEIRDTGVGIPAEELPRMFDRFHRVHGNRGRTHEGTGIGLALVQELVRLHGGTVGVVSTPGAGSTFTVRVPFGKAHLETRQVVAASPLSSTRIGASPFVEEALRWLPDVAHDWQSLTDGPDAPSAASSDAVQARSSLGADRPRVLLADDNADMRAYVGRLLAARYEVETAADGLAALEAARARLPDLVLTDIMMPRLDGLQLLQALRADPASADIPCILLSARAGEEARLDGMSAGADDYLTKPFSARELMARVDTHLKIARSRRAADQAMRRQARELEQANRTKDEFLAMLGHELRNPLSPIVTALQIMRLRGMETREQEIIERQVGHLTRLVDDLLDVSRITRGLIELRRRPMEVAEAVARAIEMASPLLEQREHRLDVEVPPLGLVVMADAGRLAQVVSNLLTNAAKYSDSGSRIELRAWKDAGGVKVSVKDEGIGIEPDMLERVFEPFVQKSQSVDRSSGGLGLGLAIVRNLVDLHQGSVGVTSGGIGHGSEFTVTLPALPVHALPATTPAAQARSAAPDAKRVLVVDDNADAAFLLKSALEDIGYTVAVAADGPSALERAQTFDPEVALLDIGLPVMDGYELGERLRAQYKDSRKLRLVALTGYGLQADRDRSAAAGFEAHLVKPIDLETLKNVLR